jgi:hypothetical protein
MKPFADIQGNNIDCKDEATPAKRVKKVRPRHLGCQIFPASLAACVLGIGIDMLKLPMVCCQYPPYLNQHHSTTVNIDPASSWQQPGSPSCTRYTISTAQVTPVGRCAELELS